MKQPLVFNSFEGGLATDLKRGIKYSFAGTSGAGTLGTYSVDFRKSPSQFTVLPGLSREDNGVVTDLVQNEAMIPDGTIYAIGDKGQIYKRTTAGVWSAQAQSSGNTFGMDYRRDTDALYIPTAKAVDLYANMSTAPVISHNYYAASYSTYNNSNVTGIPATFMAPGTATYSVPTTLSESSTNLRYFQTDIEPVSKISVFITNKGTGDWTLTLHDGTNKVLATSTVTNANLTNNTFNDFVFSSAPNGQVRLYVTPNARTYHIHVTSTVNDGTLSTQATNDLSNCALEVWADRLVQTTNGMHPMARFLQYECFGNGNYISVWEPISDPPTNDEWLRHKLTVPMEYECWGLTSFNEYLVGAFGYTSTSTTSQTQQGLLIWWDGFSPTYNYWIEVPEGIPQAIHSYKNVIYYYAGGAWYAIASPASQPVKIRTMPGSDAEYSGSATPMNVYPNAATVRRGIHLMAFPSQSVNTNVNFGVYSYGAVDKNFPDSFGLSYLISTGSTQYTAQNNLQIGMVKAFGDTLHVSWRDTSSDGGYGVDVVNNSSAPATNSSWESLIFDNGYTAKRKKGMYVQATFLTLPSDCSFRLKYKLDRASNWTYSSTFTAATVQQFNYARFDITSTYQTYFYEAQIGIDIVSGTTTPTFTSLSMVYDDNREESIGGG